MMYRPPEMIDSYKRYKVDTKVDMWMLGCILYALCFFRHPFQDSQKLAITNAHYFIPDEARSRISEKMRDLIRILLCPNPAYRPNVTHLQHLLNNWEKLNGIKLPKEVIEIKEKQEGGSISPERPPHGGGGFAGDMGDHGRGGYGNNNEFSRGGGGGGGGGGDRKGDLTFEDIKRLQQKLREGKDKTSTHQFRNDFYREDDKEGPQERRVYDNQQEFNFEDESKGG